MLNEPLIIQPQQIQQIAIMGEEPDKKPGDKKPPSCNTILCLISSGKILLGFSVLFMDKKDYSALNIWTLLEMLCDLLNIVLLLIDKKLISNMMQNNRHTPFDQESGQSITYQTTLRLFSRLKIFHALNNLYYFVLLGWAHIVYYQSLLGPKSVQLAANYVAVYIFWGYFFIGCAFVVATKDRNFGTFIAFFPSRLTSKRKRSYRINKNLNVKTFSANLPGSSECFICLNNYQEGDTLVELPCNSKHQFHEACIKKWLKVNSACPLCRKLLDGTNNPPVVNEFELTLV